VTDKCIAEAVVKLILPLLVKKKAQPLLHRLTPLGSDDPLFYVDRKES